jgi:hypothetical protein
MNLAALSLSIVNSICGRLFRVHLHPHPLDEASPKPLNEPILDASDPLGGHLSEKPWNENYRPCPVTTIDQLLEKHPLPGPFMIKLDTHGVEIPILSGASKTLKETSAIVIEAYNFTFGAPAVPFWDLCRYMLELGFRPLDVFDLLYREIDNAFWQFDLLFVRSDLALFQDPRYFIAGRH